MRRLKKSYLKRKLKLFSIHRKTLLQRYIVVSYYTRLHSKKAIWCNLKITNNLANNLMAKKYIVCFNIISNVFIFFIGRMGEKSDILWQKDKPNKLPIFSSNAQTKIVIFFLEIKTDF